MAITYDKDGAYIEVTDSVTGAVHRRSIKWVDCVVSVPGGDNLKIDLAYVNESDQLVLVLEDESEITMANTEDLSTHDTDIKTLLATIAGYIDNEIAAIITSQGRQLFTMDFWSASLEEVSLDGDAAATITLPTVTITDLPTNATIVHAVAMFKFRMIENTHADTANKLDGATSAETSQVIQIDKTGATFIDAINFVDDQFSIAAATREGGDVIIGSIDVATEVDANDTYELRWLLALADEDLLNFNDVQVGIRIWYSV